MLFTNTLHTIQGSYIYDYFLFVFT